VSELTDNIKIGKRAEKVRLKTQKQREQAQLESAKYKLKKLGIKVYHQKYMGDDMYSWAVFRSDRTNPVFTGLHWRQLSHYKVMLTNAILKEKGIG
jgi:3-deoxy-D-manno-octulosonate 8-phosphate phosphatase KdsC-like HAD superfamily phosphatase